MKTEKEIRERIKKLEELTKPHIGSEECKICQYYKATIEALKWVLGDDKEVENEN